MTEGEFFDFCQKNEYYRIERCANGAVTVQEPSGYEYGSRNMSISGPLFMWNRQARVGHVADSSAGFTLPNGAVRAPDASWISHERLAQAPLEDRKRFVHAVPEFVAEVRSRTDKMSFLREKMREYIANGVRLAWLVDVDHEVVEIYRPGRDVEVVRGFSGSLSGEDVLPGFTLDLNELKL